MADDYQDHDEVVVIAPYVQIPVWIFGLGPNCFVVFASLASFANRKTKSGWPSVPRVARRCNLSESTAHRAIKELEQFGAMKVTKRARKDGGSFVNLYDLSPAFDPAWGGAPDLIPDDVFARAMEAREGGVSQGHPLSQGHPGGVRQTPELEEEELEVEADASTESSKTELELAAPAVFAHAPTLPSRASAGAREAQRLCDHLADKIAGLGIKRPTITKSWLDDARLLVDRDGAEPAEVQAAIDYATGHHFWHRNILSMGKLRKQFDRLRLESKAERTPPKSFQETRYDDAMQSLERMIEQAPA